MSELSFSKETLEAVIFDLDGVICFTDKFHYQAWKKLADRLGIYFDETINNRLRGVSRMASLEIILERSEKVYSQAEKEAFAEMFEAMATGGERAEMMKEYLPGSYSFFKEEFKKIAKP